MEKFNITAYADYTTSWGEPCYVGVLSIQNSPDGKWVRAESVDAFVGEIQASVDAKVTEACELLKAEHIAATADMQREIQSSSARYYNDLESYAQGEHFYETEIQKLKLQLETMTADRDAEKSMKATARMQRDEQSQRIIGLKERLNHAYKLLGHNP